MQKEDLPNVIRSILEDRNASLEERCGRALTKIGEVYGAMTLTLHRAETRNRLLHEVACVGIPDHLRPVTRTIPFGKGMAGLCAEKREPVTVCNLQTDDSGVAKPGAKETGVAGGIVVPIVSSSGDTVVGTLGVGKPIEHEYDEEERRILMECAACFSEFFS